MTSYPPEKGLPNRAGTASTEDDDAIPDFDPTNSAGILQERLQAWKHACGYLEDYVGATEKVQRTHSKEYEKILKTINNPLKEGHHFDQSVGGIAGLLENMRTNTHSIATSHLEASKALEGTVLPILKRLHGEIKSKNKEIEKGATKGAKSVDQARNSTQKHVELLGQHSASFDSSGSKITPDNDPYVLQRGIQHRLHRQIMEENNNRDDLIAVQNSFAAFEAHIIQTFQHAMGAFLQAVGGQADRQKALYTDIVGNSQHITGDFEWTRFVHRNNAILIDPATPKRELRHVTYPNQDHPSTKPLIAGTLERKSKLGALGGGYKAGYYVVSPSKYFHQYEDDDNFRKDPSPDMSLYLPDCTIGALAGEKFNIKGKDAGKKALAMSHELQFKAASPHEAQRWHEVLSKAVGVGGLTNSVPSSPVDTRTGGAAPLQTQNLPPASDSASAGLQSATTSGVPPSATSTSSHGGHFASHAPGQTSGVIDSPTVAKAP